jgi:hypothetical protein
MAWPSQALEKEILMKNARRFTLLILLALVASALIAAAPAPAQAGLAKSDLVRLTIINQDKAFVSLRLYGDQFYYLPVNAGETRIYTPARDVYTATLFSCGVYTTQTLDLTRQYTLVVPACGTKATQGPTEAGTIDAGDLLKLVKVTLVNETGNYMLLILEGPQTYVFSFDKDEERSFTITKGEYTYRQYACGTIFSANFYAHANKVKEFDCP